MKGSAEEAAKHQHGVQVRETGTTGNPVTESRFAALEKRIEELEAKIEQFLARAVAKAAETGAKKEKEKAA